MIQFTSLVKTDVLLFLDTTTLHRRRGVYSSAQPIQEMSLNASILPCLLGFHELPFVYYTFLSASVQSRVGSESGRQRNKFLSNHYCKV